MSGSYSREMSGRKNNDWAELDDRYNFVDETQIEPDYFIDAKVSDVTANLNSHLPSLSQIQMDGQSAFS